MPLDPSDVVAIRAAERALTASFEAPDPTAWVASYTPDATFALPGAPAAEGREALLEMARAMTPISEAEIVAEHTDGDGSIATVLGVARWRSGPRGSDAPETHLRGLWVWRREPDGAWRILRELLHALLD